MSGCIAIAAGANRESSELVGSSVHLEARFWVSKQCLCKGNPLVLPSRHWIPSVKRLKSGEKGYPRSEDWEMFMYKCTLQQRSIPSIDSIFGNQDAPAFDSIFNNQGEDTTSEPLLNWSGGGEDIDELVGLLLFFSLLPDCVVCALVLGAVLYSSFSSVVQLRYYGVVTVVGVAFVTTASAFVASYSWSIFCGGFGFFCLVFLDASGVSSRVLCSSLALV
ncbi:hypothetical protein U1Q18_027298 [Sarracenia purpurea var. burkii]